jgi:predicted GNAT family acetyltransferase
VNVDVRHEPAEHRFIAIVDGKESVLLYAPAGEGSVDFRSTFVDPSLRNRGVGDALVRTAVAWAREEGLTIVPSCWFVARWLELEAARGVRRSAKTSGDRETEGRS